MNDRHPCEEMILFAIRSGPVVVALLDGQLAIHAVTENVERITGFAPSQFLDDPLLFASRIHHDDVAHFSEAFRETARQPSDVSVEYRWKVSDDSFRWFLDYFTPTANGRTIRTSLDISTRKAAEEQLRSSETESREIVASMAEGVLLFATDGRVMDANPAAQEMMGMSLDQFRSASFDDWEVENEGRRIDFSESAAATVLESGERVQHVERRVVTAGGRRVDVRITAAPIRDDTGRIRAIVGTMTDITNQRDAERSLRESEEQLRAFLQNIPGVVDIRTLDGRFTFLNAFGSSLLGLRREDVVGKAPADLLRQQLLRSREQFARVIETGAPVRFLETVELEARTSRFSVTQFPIFERGEVKLIGSVAMDVTDEQRTLEALARSESRGRAMLSAIPDFVLRVEKGGRVVEVLSPGEVCFDLPTEQWSGRHLSEQLPASVVSRFLECLDLVFESRTAQVFECEMTVSERGCTVEARIAAIDSTEAMVLFRDITARRVQEDERNRREAELQATLAQAEGEFEEIKASNLAQYSQQEERRKRERQAVNRIVAVVATTLNLAELVSILAHELSSGLGNPAGVIMLDESAHRQSFFSSWGLDSDLARSLSENFGESGSGLDGFTLPPGPWHHSLKVPLTAQGSIVLFRDSTGKPFASEETVFYQAIGTGIGFAIENARLFEEIRDSRERLTTLSRRLVTTQEAERRHLGRELHDQIGQTLTALKLILETIHRSERKDSGPSLAEAGLLLAELMGQVRNLSLDLRPATLDDLGLLPTLLWHFARWESQTGIRLRFDHDGLESRRFEPELETAAYRIVQEALTNVARHAAAEVVAVRAWATSETLLLQIEDEGIGFDAISPLGNERIGLGSLRERAELLGGQLRIESQPGAGTFVMVEIPLNMTDPAGTGR